MDRALERTGVASGGNCCEYCRVAQEYDRLPFEIDHIIALKHRGLTRASNLCLACSACNNHKGSNIAGIDDITNQVVKLFHPGWTAGMDLGANR